MNELPSPVVDGPTPFLPKPYATLYLEVGNFRSTKRISEVWQQRGQQSTEVGYLPWSTFLSNKDKLWGREGLVGYAARHWKVSRIIDVRKRHKFSLYWLVSSLPLKPQPSKTLLGRGFLQRYEPAIQLVSSAPHLTRAHDPKYPTVFLQQSLPVSCLFSGLFLQFHDLLGAFAILVSPRIIGRTGSLFRHRLGGVRQTSQPAQSCTRRFSRWFRQWIGRQRSLVSDGPKNHGYKTKKGKVVCKVRSFSLNSEGKAQLNYDVMKLMKDVPWTSRGRYQVNFCKENSSMSNTHYLFES